jgi:hypothetical protein
LWVYFLTKNVSEHHIASNWRAEGFASKKKANLRNSLSQIWEINSSCCTCRRKHLVDDIQIKPEQDPQGKLT